MHAATPLTSPPTTTTAAGRARAALQVPGRLNTGLRLTPTCVSRRATQFAALPGLLRRAASESHSLKSCGTSSEALPSGR